MGRIAADYFPLRDLRLNANYTSAYEDSLVEGNIEYLTPIPGLAFTGEIAYGDNAYHQWLLGVRYYFGANKPLRDRDREDGVPGTDGTACCKRLACMATNLITKAMRLTRCIRRTEASLSIILADSEPPT